MLFSILLACAFVGAVAAFAGGMQSKKLGTNVCQTKGGGRFVEIKQFPGEYVDRRLRKDVRFMIRKYKIYITDGYAESGHSINGEHPLGLALDIVPNFAKGGSWDLIDKLAKWAEPVQNQPRKPFRWVGYDGDVNHGRGHHLHLSFDHGRSKPFKPVRKMLSVKCPKTGTDSPDPEPQPQPEPPSEPKPAPDSGGAGDDAEPQGKTAPAKSGGLKGRRSSTQARSQGEQEMSARQARAIAKATEHGHEGEQDRSLPVGHEGHDH